MPKNLSLLLCLACLLFGWGSGTAQAADIGQEQRRQLLLQQVQLLQAQIAAVKLERRVLAGSYLAIDTDGKVILGKNSDKSYPIASITKLMNALVAVENVGGDQRITLQKEMLKPAGQSPSLFLGLQVSANHLLKASLIQSTNDAAQALSYFIGNDHFVSLMNEKARGLGMSSTSFYDAHGLDPKNHSSAADLAKLVAHIYQYHPEILTITKDNDFWLPDQTGKLLKFKNINNFYQLPEFVGGKTGYLPQAKQSLASLFMVRGKPVILVLLYSQNRQTDALTLINHIKNSMDSV